MGDFAKLVLVMSVAVSSIGCGQTENLNPNQSVTVRLPSARPFAPEPGFTSAAEPRSSSSQEHNQAGTLSDS